MITNEIFVFAGASLLLAFLIFIIRISSKGNSDNSLDPLAANRSYSCGWAVFFRVCGWINFVVGFLIILFVISNRSGVNIDSLQPTSIAVVILVSSGISSFFVAYIIQLLFDCKCHLIECRRYLGVIAKK